VWHKLQLYPRAFWILLACFLVNRVAASLIWPFMTLFIREQTGAALASVTALLSIQAVASVAGTTFISGVMDRYGRRLPMLVGLLAFCGVLLLMSQAFTLWQWALLIALYGVLQPIVYVGTNAMVADLVAPADRTGAYAIVRVVSNLAIALGPALGGAFIVQSNLFAYGGAALLNLALLLPMTWFIRETLPKAKRRPAGEERGAGGYAALLKDRPFISFILAFTLLEIGAALTFNLLAVYVREQYAMLEDAYGRLVAINALMVVLFQYPVTRQARHHPPFTIIAVGCLFYTAGLVGFGLAQSWAGFALAMVILTTGELLVMPTATALVAGMAQPDLRARYMGIFSLTYTVGTGLGPLIGGLVADALAPAAIWYFGGTAALLAAVLFVLLQRHATVPHPVPPD
jgi:MFS family permease